MTQLSKVKQNIHRDNNESFNLNTKYKNTYSRPKGVYGLFLLTVPIEELAYWQHKTVLIIFPLNLQTILARTI